MSIFLILAIHSCQVLYWTYCQYCCQVFCWHSCQYCICLMTNVVVYFFIFLVVIYMCPILFLMIFQIFYGLIFFLLICSCSVVIWNHFLIDYIFFHSVYFCYHNCVSFDEEKINYLCVCTRTCVYVCVSCLGNPCLAQAHKYMLLYSRSFTLLLYWYL